MCGKSYTACQCPTCQRPNHLLQLAELEARARVPGLETEELPLAMQLEQGAAVHFPPGIERAAQLRAEAGAGTGAEGTGDGDGGWGGDGPEWGDEFESSDGESDGPSLWDDVDQALACPALYHRPVPPAPARLQLAAAAGVRASHAAAVAGSCHPLSTSPFSDSACGRHLRPLVSFSCRAARALCCAPDY